MSTILIKDALRQSVEAASGGEQTVIYTAKGQPSFMNIIRKFDLSSINPSLSGTHPAFVINGVEKDQILVGTYHGKVNNGEFISQPNTAPTANIQYDQAIAAARANGAGHHIITAAEWGAVAIQAQANGVKPIGNSYYGRTSSDATQMGRRVDGVAAGTNTGGLVSAATLTGSGPVSWRHNRKYNGISDMSGNIYEWCAGYRIFNGEIQVIENNNAAILTTDLSAASAEWKAIDGSNGNLITPNGYGTTPNSVKVVIGSSTTNDYTIAAPSWGNLLNVANNTGSKPVSTQALKLLKALGLFPISTTIGSYSEDAQIYSSSQGETILARGNYWAGGSAAGIFSTNLSYLRTRSDLAIGSRPAYYTP